jgi:hypothetical protein
MNTAHADQPTPSTRAQLDALKARYDSEKVSPAIFAVVKELETQIAWQQHRGGHDEY